MKTGVWTHDNRDMEVIENYMADRINVMRIRIKQLEEDVKFWQGHAHKLGYEEGK